MLKIRPYTNYLCGAPFLLIFSAIINISAYWATSQCSVQFILVPQLFIRTDIKCKKLHICKHSGSEKRLRQRKLLFFETFNVPVIERGTSMKNQGWKPKYKPLRA